MFFDQFLSGQDKMNGENEKTNETGPPFPTSSLK